jgi:chemotaxis signal transduction protein
VSNFATIRYPDLNLLIDYSENSSFFPLDAIKGITENTSRYPSYCLGIAELGGTVCLIIDFAKFLNIRPATDQIELLLLKIADESGDFALVLPTPKVLRSDIQVESIEKIKHDQKVNFQIPASKYFIIDDEVYLQIRRESLVEFISNEVAYYLTKNWKKTVPSWTFKEEDNLARITEQKELTIKSKDSIYSVQKVRNNIAICSIEDYRFAFHEEFMHELLAHIPTISPVPDSPPWVLGVIDYQNESIPLANIANWLDMSEQSIENKLLVVLNYSGFKFALLTDSVDIIEYPSIIPTQHPELKTIKSVPFSNIIKIDDKNIFLLKLDELSNSFDNDQISDNWDTWREYFSTNQDFITKALRGSMLADSQDLNLIKFVDIQYDDVNIILDIDERHSFHPFQLGQPFKHSPSYCSGIAEIEGRVCLLIDLAKFLGIETDMSTEEKMLIRLTSESNDNFAFIVPIPSVVEYDLESKSITKLGSQKSYTVPSSQYYIIDNQIKLRIGKKQLVDFIIFEVSNELKQKWNEILPEWSRVDTTELAQLDKKVQFAPKIQESVLSSKESRNQIVVCTIGDNLFGVEEEYIVEIISEKNVITSIPDSSIWVEGTMDYQNESIAVLDLANWLNIPVSDQHKEITVVIKSSKGKFAFYCASAYTRNIGEFEYFRENYTLTDLPYSNIMKINSEHIFLLNIEYIKNAIEGTQSNIDWDFWREFLSISQEYRVKSDVDGEEITSEENSLYTTAGDNAFLIPIAEIITIRSTSIPERTRIQEIDLVEYENAWIPSFNLNQLISDETDETSQISIVVKRNESIFELQAEQMQLVEKGEQLINSSSWNMLLGGVNPIGLEPAISTKAGIAFGLNTYELSENVFQAKTDLKTGLSKFVKTIDITPPQEVEQVSLLSKEMAQLWEEDVVLFLIINDRSAKTKKHAMSVDTITSISLEIEEDTEVIPWEFSSLEHYFYVSTADPQSHSKAIQIPSDCYLHAVNKENIKSDEDVTYVIIEEERIPLRKA